MCSFQGGCSCSCGTPAITRYPGCGKTLYACFGAVGRIMSGEVCWLRDLECLELRPRKAEKMNWL